MKFRFPGKRRGHHARPMKAADSRRWRKFLTVESLESRTLLAKYAGFAEFVASTLESLDTITTTATSTPLPGIATAVNEYLTSNPLLASDVQALAAIDDSSVDTATAEAALLQNALGVPVTPVGDTFELVLTGGTGTTPLDVPVSGFNAGLPSLGFTTAGHL